VEAGQVSSLDKDLNEELNWKVSYELGTLDPFVEDAEQVQGGKHSKSNKWYPYKNWHEMKLALKVIFMTEDITKMTWALWIGTQLHLQDILDGEQDNGLPAIPSRPESEEQLSEGASKRSKSTHQKTPDLIETIDLTVSPGPSSESKKYKAHELSTAPILSSQGYLQHSDGQNYRLESTRRLVNYHASSTVVHHTG
jgi:hypothetical protein